MSQLALRAQNDYIFNLQVQMDKYARLISTVNVRIKSLEDEYKTVQQKVAQLRLKRNEGDQRGGGINAVKSMIMCENREVGKLENRLAACRTRESKLVATNTDLKKKIDALRANRLFSQTVFEKNQKRLRDIQRQMQETFKASTIIMGERDKVIAQAHSLASVNMEEQEAFDDIYQNLAMIIAREKESADSFRKEALKSETLEAHDESYVRGSYRIDEEAEMKLTLHKLDVALREDKTAIEVVSERLKLHESTFKQMMKHTGCDDYHKLVDIYTKKEEENFALFRYVQNINNESEQLEEQTAALQREQQRYADELKEGSANMRKRLIDSLEETRQKILKENVDYERLRQNAQREFGPIARAVDKLYNSLGCNEMAPPSANSVNAVSGKNDDQNAMAIRMSSMNDLLAAHGITEGNILQFLAIIEQRSNDLLEQFTRRLQHKNPQNLATTSLGAHLQPSDPNRANGLHLNFNLNQAPPHLIEGNSELENNSDEDDGLVPVSTSELQRKAAKSLSSHMQVNTKFSPGKNKNKKRK
ncbi:hypothetical protein SPRG_13957 [Saprolegnia parasitica CBS 223.65]|uniref:ODAD1 central coiled coil region domain-containing protein n=1 Tax=Saprolegnia parasitica (strain CBS 223.65) TaxID=695850 RepID=A0A067BR83_SAPPC|nr:hypothetical protein SPRG_13957 [Saprolegnia parasitica CBS 223.65]KDO21029.1 hypothetical protein SPRG_13957 [Saprolegnia parasitica CBS 223.65]|eukprot:XP_012208281.1 hypothetical protein SPRG_13957 [Saprolegnia parasitica CBS 223.65]